MDMELDFGQYYEIGFNTQLIEVFQAIRAYLFTLEELEKCQGPFGDEAPLRELADQRNLIQHSLLSLPSVEQVPGCYSKSLLLYEACRISGLIFSVGVVFPIPYEAAPLASLMRLLKLELQRIPQSRCQSACAKGVLIWMLVLGGITAIDTQERYWFVHELRTMAETSSVCEWSQLKRILKRILWLDGACDIAGQELWDEVKSSRLS
ncbi:hypothetical protein N7510_008174 [Penicillium lagena]|uniref:uncharacterized protein n=1 Tax=Penicillium lagena TaxID=94218 RepID=UPI002541A2C1|nr:uncharacterized protein N7510_008174 [Penicillium lagena]KAJ5605393.1 hypothetical protein N7510_008174 [Penicillium lagena]